MCKGAQMNGSLFSNILWHLYDVIWVIFFLRGTGVEVQCFWSIFLWYLYILFAEMFLSLIHAWYFWSKWCRDCKCFYFLEFCGLIIVWNGKILFCGQIFWISIKYLKVVLCPCIVYVLHIFFLCKTSVEILVALFGFSARSTFVKRDLWSRFVGAWPSGM